MVHIKTESLSGDSSDDFQGEAEGGFVGGFGEGLKSFFEFLLSEDMPEIKHLLTIILVPRNLPA